MALPRCSPSRRQHGVQRRRTYVRVGVQQNRGKPLSSHPVLRPDVTWLRSLSGRTEVQAWPDEGVVATRVHSVHNVCTQCVTTSTTSATASGDVTRQFSLAELLWPSEGVWGPEQGSRCLERRHDRFPTADHEQAGTSTHPGHPPPETP